MSGHAGLLDEATALANTIADKTGALLLDYFRHTFSYRLKDDLSPVSQADHDAETLARSMITDRFPDHGIIGEEMPPYQSQAQWLWVLDPLDGTRGFLSGIPLFGQLIGLVHQSKPVYGLLNHPALGERWQAHVDGPCWHRVNNAMIGQNRQIPNGNRAPMTKVTASSCHHLSKARLAATSPHMFGDNQPRFKCLRHRVESVHYGTDCYAYGLLALGLMDIVAEATMKTGDFCALVPVVKAAGGVITDWQGDPLHPKSDGTVLASANNTLHRKALLLLAKSP